MKIVYLPAESCGELNVRSCGHAVGQRKKKSERRGPLWTRDKSRRVGFIFNWRTWTWAIYVKHPGAGRIDRDRKTRKPFSASDTARSTTRVRAWPSRQPKAKNKNQIKTKKFKIKLLNYKNKNKNTQRKRWNSKPRTRIQRFEISDKSVKTVYANDIDPRTHRWIGLVIVRRTRRYHENGRTRLVPTRVHVRLRNGVICGGGRVGDCPPYCGRGSRCDDMRVT